MKEILKNLRMDSFAVSTVGPLYAKLKKCNKSVSLVAMPKVTVNNNEIIGSIGVSVSDVISQFKYKGSIISNLLSKVDKHAIDVYAAHRGCLDVRAAACMAAHVYGNYNSSLLMDGWMPDASFDDEIVLYKGDIQSKLYSRVDKEGIKEYAFVFAGTREINLKDWRNNIWQILGLSSDYSQALKNAKLLSDKLKDSKLFFVGHSKGGGEASLCSLATGRPAVVFNPAPLSRFTVLFNGERMPNDVSIDAYVCTKDPLYLLNEALKKDVLPVAFLRFVSLRTIVVLRLLGLDIIGKIHLLDFKGEKSSVFEPHFMKSILTFFEINHSIHKLSNNLNIHIKVQN